MTKSDFIDKVANKTDWTKKDAEVAVNGVIEALTDVFVSGEKLSLVGFGSFEVAERAERKARNPQTGESMLVAACKAPKFKPSKALKDLVNGK